VLIKTLKMTLLVLSLTLTTSLLAENSYLSDLEIETKITSVMEGAYSDLESEGAISIYNTGIALEAKDQYGFSAQFRGSVDGKVTEIDEDDFDLETFVKELNVNYQKGLSDVVLLATVGKMSDGVKTDQSDPKELGGVMGIRLTIKFGGIRFIKDWLKKNGLKISRITITRYNSESEERFDLDDLSTANMTSYAIKLARDRSMQAFLVHKVPDNNNHSDATSTSVGGVYMFDNMKYKPQVFVMKHKSYSKHVDLDLDVFSVSVEVLDNIRAKVSYASAVENIHGGEEDVYDFGLTKKFFKNSKTVKIKGTAGVEITRSDSNDETYYVELEVEY
jgi:hypothetical protein